MKPPKSLAQRKRSKLRDKTPNIVKLLEAVDFAAAKHSNQRRKDKHGTPYINHPIKVAYFLANQGGVDDIITLIAAILHDTIEDTETTPEELEKKFGKEVRNLIENELTDDKSLPKAERKLLQIKNASHKSFRAELIKIADFICNIEDLIQNPPPDWSIQRKRDYLDWSMQVVRGFSERNRALNQYFDDLIERARSSIEQDS